MNVPLFMNLKRPHKGQRILGAFLLLKTVAYLRINLNIQADKIKLHRFGQKQKFC